MLKKMFEVQNGTKKFVFRMFKVQNVEEKTDIKVIEFLRFKT